ncbi:MAG: hypothetical protein ACYTEL_04550 [Planctomycetota bacterium]|jgi:hypothetical protein
MSIIVKVVGIVLAAFAVVYLLKPEVMRWLMRALSRGRRIYFGALIRFALAILFLLSARECTYFWPIFVLGILFLLGGMVIIVLGPAKLRPVLAWGQELSTVVLRLLALVTLGLGVLVIISG